MASKPLSVKLLKILLGIFIAIMLMLTICLFLKSSVTTFLGHAVDQKIVFANDNSDKWGNFTDDGTINVLTKVRYYERATPVSASKAYAVQELPEVVYSNVYKTYEPTFIDDGNRIGYMREVTPVPQDLTKKFEGEIINFLGIVFWYRVKNLSVEDRAFTALSSVVTGIGLNINKQLRVALLFKVFDKLGEYMIRFFLTRNLSVSSDMAHFMMTDSYFGFRTQTGLAQWLDSYEKADVLKQIVDYYGISMADVVKAQGNLSNLIDMATKILEFEIGCNNNCDRYSLLLRQWANSEISKPLLKQASLADDETLFGLLEFSAFYQARFAKIPGFENSGLTVQQARTLINIDLDKLDYSKDWNNLVHKGNVYDIFKAGKQYDENKDDAFLEPLIERFGLKDSKQALVLYEYLKYLGDEFLPSKAYNGSIEITTFSALYAEYSKKLFLDIVQFFREEFLPYFFLQWALKNHNENCDVILKDSINDIPDDKVATLCEAYTDQNQVFTALYLFCELNNRSLFDLTDDQFNQICRTSSDKPASYDLIRSTMSNMLVFNFGSSNAISLAAIQFAEAKVTQKSSPYVKDRYPVAESLYDWNPKRFNARFELAVIAKDNNIDPATLVAYTGENFLKLLNDMRLFAQPVVNMAIITNRGASSAYFDRLFSIGQPAFFEIYVKEFVRSYVLGGKYLKIDQSQVIDGIPLQILSDLKNKPIILGGDPSIDETFGLVKKVTGYAIKTTGKDNIKKLDNFHVFNNFSVISVGLPAFNGNSTVVNYTGPWKQETPVTGCELFCEPYDKDESSIEPADKKYTDLTNTRVDYFQDALARTLRLDFVGSRTVDQGGFIINKFKMDNSQLLANEANSNYFQNKYNGAFNMTSVVGGPFFMTKNRFLDAEEAIKQNVEFFDENGQPAAPREDIDDVYFETENLTNGCTTNNVNFQLNIRIEENEMFKYNDNEDVLYPILNIYGYQRFEDSYLSTKFNEILPIYRYTSYYYMYVLIPLVIFAIIAIGIWFAIRKLSAKDKNEYIEEGQHAESLMNN